MNILNMNDQYYSFYFVIIIIDTINFDIMLLITLVKSYLTYFVTVFSWYLKWNLSICLSGEIKLSLVYNIFHKRQNWWHAPDGVPNLGSATPTTLAVLFITFAT